MGSKRVGNPPNWTTHTSTTILAIRIWETFRRAPISPLFHPESHESKQSLLSSRFFFWDVLFKVHYGFLDEVGIRASR